MAARTKRLAACLVALALLGAAPQPRDAAQSRRATRIVSLVPAVTEMLFAIGAGPQVVGVSSYDEFPPEVKALPRLGALLDPDVERVLTLRPDLVVSYGSQDDLHAQLGRARIAVFSYRHAGIEGIFKTIAALGAATGHEADADRLSRRIRADLDGIRARVKGRTRPRTLLVFERDAATLRGIYVSGGRGFLHEMLDVAGGENVFADTPREAVQPSHETLLTRAPDVILEVSAKGLITNGAVTERNVWAPLGSIPAVRSGRIFTLVGEHLVVPGPRVAQGTEAFARALHPEAFK